MDADGGVHRFIESVSEHGDIFYFKCDNFGVSPRGLINRYHPYAIGDEKYGEAVMTRVVVNGREVGKFLGQLPNIFVVGDIRQIPGDDGRSLFDRLVAGDGGRLKLETSQEKREQVWDYKYSLNGIKRAMKWCIGFKDEDRVANID